MKNDTPSRPNGWALTPFLLFALFYVGLSVAAGDFYKVKMPVAFLVASAAALACNRCKSFAERIETYARGMGETNIMVMCLIFVLAGAFATVAKESGAVDSAVLIAQTFIPGRLLLAGLFLVSCLISLSIGTSCGTIAAVTPIALELAEPLGLSAAIPVGAVVGGAMFGDNLSMISDTTIAATRTQGIAMRDKFLANIGIAAPAAVLTLLVYIGIGVFGPAAEAPLDAATWHDALLITPYLLILGLALAGFNVMALLFSGTVLAAVLGVVLKRVDCWDALDLIGNGALGMSETLIVALLAGGLFKTVQDNGGISWLTDRISRLVRGPRSCEAGVGLLVGAVNLFTANNTVAIVIAGPIARTCADRFKADPVRIASVLDTVSCIVQGLIPYGAQILIAVGIAREFDPSFSNLGLIAGLYYQPLLALAVITAMAIPGKRSVAV